jgi:hypothetical protein
MYCEKYLDSKEADPKTRLANALRETAEWSVKEGMTDEEVKNGQKLFAHFYKSKFFDKIKLIIIQETKLWSFIGGGYAGRVDFIYENHNGDHVIGDFKSSKKPKRKLQNTGKLQKLLFWGYLYFVFLLT